MGRKECLSRILHETAIAVHRKEVQILRLSATLFRLNGATGIGSDSHRTSTGIYELLH
jgi:hypothetical protein